MLKKAAALAVVLTSGVILSSTIFAAPATPGNSNRPSFSIPGFAKKDATRSASIEGRIRACQARAEAIKTRSTNLVKMSNNMVSTFDKIAQRVSDFYLNRVVPEGSIISNYDSLVADIAAKKALVTNNLNKASSDAMSFSCNSDKPRDQIKMFNQDMQAVKKDLKNYRTSIKNLIVAIHSKSGGNDEATGSGKTNQMRGKEASHGGMMSQ